MKKELTLLLTLTIFNQSFTMDFDWSRLNPANIEWSKLNPMNWSWSEATSEIDMDIEGIKEDLANMPTHAETRVGTSFSGSNSFGIEAGTSILGTYTGLGTQYDKRNSGFGASHIPVYLYTKKAFPLENISFVDYRVSDFFTHNDIVPYVTGRIGNNIYAEHGESGGAHYGAGIGLLFPTMSVEMLWTGTNLKAEYKNSSNLSLALGYRF